MWVCRHLKEPVRIGASWICSCGVSPNRSLALGAPQGWLLPRYSIMLPACAEPSRLPPLLCVQGSTEAAPRTPFGRIFEWLDTAEQFRFEDPKV